MKSSAYSGGLDARFFTNCFLLITHESTPASPFCCVRDWEGRFWNWRRFCPTPQVQCQMNTWMVRQIFWFEIQLNCLLNWFAFFCMCLIENSQILWMLPFVSTSLRRRSPTFWSLGVFFWDSRPFPPRFQTVHSRRTNRKRYSLCLLPPEEEPLCWDFRVFPTKNL